MVKRTTPKTIEGAGGEEWRNFEKSKEYDATRHHDLIETARARIPQIRQRDVRVRLLGRDGQPLANRSVDVVQTRSAFTWGYCGWGHVASMGDGTFHSQEREHLHHLEADLFNTINLMHYWAETHCDNAPVSEEYQGHVSYDALDATVQWALGHGLKAKGHPLYWPVAKAIPPWVLKYDIATRRKFLEVRIRQICARFRGRMSFYDAVNEMMWEPTLAHTEQRHWPHLEQIEDIAEEAAMVLRWAREEDPDATYVLNEYGIARGDHAEIPVPANDGSTITRNQQFDRYLDLLKKLVEMDEAPDAAGLQTPPGNWDSHDMQVATFDAIGEATGLPVHITEFRTNTKPLEEKGLPEDEITAQVAEYLGNVITLCYGNPNVEAFFFWGANRMYNGRRPTAVYDTVRRLIRDEWMTDKKLVTESDGSLSFRGFCGDYSLRVHRASGQKTGVGLTVPQGPKSACTVELVLPIPA